MFDLSFFTRLIQTNYDADIAALQPFPSSFVPDTRAVCRITLADGTLWTLRAGKRDASVPDWLVGCGAATTPEWLASRAATLQYMQAHAFPAPHVVATRTGGAIGEANGWCTFVATFIEGHVADPTPHTLRGMGAALGRLHRLPLPSSPRTIPQPGLSWWFPEIAIPAGLQQYARLRPTLPDEWTPTVDAFCATLRAVQRADLPRAVIHGDGWAGNAVQTSDGQTVLIDWDPSGQGIAILDLGRLLVSAHQTLSAPTAVPTYVSPASIEAVVDGYCQERTLTANERSALLEAIRFGVAFGAASHFARAQQAGWLEPWRGRLARRQHWYELSTVIAEIADKRLEHIA
jgi:Ser/Thr protein kinase RdoA (MazF antagonist)